ncbi:long-chain-fatty-acid--CoA ligase [Bradyrhizobium sp. U87765 SZCCT0131]|uniref:class I adenylate-forming enzyme family protein n=1 Tax=unclassified Bradyrhizobium TaxID=2631580 RepID=UPI001BAE04EE|nr:long-chain-fatty-acid--CoA ligase [Bradyrhizobium sp. U87765 SZCCT0131]MBR1262203.1 long-chain-fatty-acid--CoA ligase [Bradyrhizobium sp. U87765 SZCCT0134]MBR1308614.1 long-chain-fatty-acid--CoA ligase [Bradyrhizobium sp. U87765 SZCCT0110]MBR1317985.1 long-chain-fatty-acid--CoA ligase [Bradyrhizobium sp. U87765 SZCCT0109]MBR1351688.1 long-chain-fatty-acid--CoA ligase [Bradyrhizobium sp. U87765 SZCCT0048]
MDLSHLIERNATFTPDKPALRFDGGTLTYAELQQRIATTAQALKAEYGVGRGDRVAILSLNHPDYLVLLYACARLGAMLVPLNWRLAVAEQVFILSDATVKVVVLQQAFATLLPPLTAALPDARPVGLDFTPERGLSFDTLLTRAHGDGRNPHTDLSCPLLIVYTSGTTGRPKGAVLRQEALLWNGMMSQHMHGLTSDDHVLTVLPFFHVGGLNIQTTPALHHGATVTIHDRFTPDHTLATIAQERPTLTVLVPATMQAVLDHPAWADTDLSSLKAIATGSTIVPPALIDRFTARGVPVLQVYGSTETCPIAIYTRIGGDLSRRGSTGLPGLWCEAAVVDDDGAEVAPGAAGEIVVRGPNVFFEYWGNEQATRDALHDGWYRTGDIGTRDADGYVWVHDRKKNMIISGGENIYPAEIERVLLQHPEVADVGVIGVPDPKWQEVPVAYVVRRTGCTVAPDTLKVALTAHVQAELARFKVPRDVVFVEDLPRTALGKVQHFRLKESVRRE